MSCVQKSNTNIDVYCSKLYNSNSIKCNYKVMSWASTAGRVGTVARAVLSLLLETVCGKEYTVANTKGASQVGEQSCHFIVVK